MKVKSLSPRLLFLDALRGFAALGVLLHHMFISPLLFGPLSHALPKPARDLLFVGALGVDIFFVLSGFVIAHSLRDNPLTRQSVTNFMLRRQIRLDLPYWTVVVVSLGLVLLQGASSASWRFLSPGVALAQFFYVQYLLGLPTLLGIAWTLCLEVQFYLIFVFLLCFGKALSSRASSAQSSVPKATVALIALSAALCLGLKFFALNVAWFWSSWFYFAAGVLTYWAWKRVVSPWFFWGTVGSFAAAIALTFVLPPSSTSVFFFHLASFKALSVGLMTFGLIYFLARRGRLETASCGRIAQFLGRISYSLYLTHAVVLTGLELVSHSGGHAMAIQIFWAGPIIALCLAVAWLFHLAVELPAMRLANRFKVSPSAPPPRVAVNEVAA